MKSLSQVDEPGILLVLAQPTASKYLQAFHEWYDTEHGPARLKLGRQYFSNGLRYRTTDESPIWLAIYDMEQLSAGSDPIYTSLRENRSKREQEVLRKANRVFSRQFLRLVSTTGDAQEPAPSIICVSFKAERSISEGMSSWYSKDVFEKFGQLHLCSRSRLFELVDGSDMEAEKAVYISIHDLNVATTDDCGATLSSIEQWLRQVLSTRVSELTIRTFVFHRAFAAEDYRQPPEDFNLDAVSKL